MPGGRRLADIINDFDDIDITKLRNEDFRIAVILLI
jgi:hypothetical protein